MKNQTLSISQMRHLQELGVDTSKASMFYVPKLEPKDEYFLLNVKPNPVIRYIPAFTLQDIIELLPAYIFLPKNTQYALFIEYRAVYEAKMVLSYKLNNSTITCSEDNERYFNRQLLYSKCGEPKEVLYQALCWCAQNGYLKGGEK